jgi:hypothetical protein
MPKQSAVQEQPAVRVKISAHEVDNDFAEDLADGQSFIRVENYDGADGYTIFERRVLLPGFDELAYRTAQRIDLATRLQLSPDYDPADVVGRAFVVGG